MSVSGRSILLTFKDFLVGVDLSKEEDPMLGAFDKVSLQEGGPVDCFQEVSPSILPDEVWVLSFA